MRHSTVFEEVTRPRRTTVGLCGTETIVLIAALLTAVGAYPSRTIAADPPAPQPDQPAPQLVEPVPQPPKFAPQPVEVERPLGDVVREAMKKAELHRLKVLDALRKAGANQIDQQRIDAVRQRANIQAEQLRARQMIEIQQIQGWQLQLPNARAAFNARGGVFNGVNGGVVFPQNATGNADAGASLKTDAELDRLLKRADEFAEEGRYDLAVVLWQKVLDGSADTVMTREEWLHKTSKHEYRKYRSVSEEIERSLAKLPANGLRVYRATADGEAKAILAASEDDPRSLGGHWQEEHAAAWVNVPTGPAPLSRREQALAEVVRRFFLSSHGDDAAFELACLEMERYEFVGASRLLNKLLHEYPDSDVAEGQILLRLAVANGRIGDRDTARQVLATLQTSADANLQHVSLVEHDVERSLGQRSHVAAQTKADSPGGWRMRLGGPSRTGHMKALPPGTTNSPLTELWSKPLDVMPAKTAAKQATSTSAAALVRNGLAPPQVIQLGGGRLVANQVVLRGGVVLRSTSSYGSQTTTPAAVSPSSMIEHWKKAGWNLTGALLLDRRHVFFKDKDRLICCDAATGEVSWMGRRNQYRLDSPSTGRLRVVGLRISYQASGQPMSAAEIALFGDRVPQSMSIVGDLILNLEGRLLELESDWAANSSQTARLRPGSSAAYAMRTNWLSAYDVPSGKLKWYRSAGDEQDASNLGVRFLAAPVPYADLLLAPVANGGQLWVYGMTADDGKTVWKAFLCDEPPGGRPRWSPVGMAVAGGDAYVASGAGAVFALDAATGTVRWVQTYPRTSLSGFREDVVIPQHRQLVVMCSDYDHLVAFDRRTGDLLWESPMNPSTNPSTGDSPSAYCLGVVADDLYVGGKNNLRRYDVAGGRLVWETKIEDSLGHGILTETAIYAPLHDAILQIDLKTGAELGRIPVVLPGSAHSPAVNREPLGNLYCDGQRLLVVGMEEVYALGELKPHLEKLDKLVEQGNGRAQLGRMRVRARLDNLDGAVADLRGAYDLLLEDEGLSEANCALYEAISDLGLDTADPLLSLELLLESVTAAGKNSPASKAFEAESAARRADVLYKTLKSLHEKQLEGAASLVLGVAVLCTDGRALTAARQAIAITVDRKDEAALRKALQSDDPNLRAVGATGLTVALREQSAGKLKKMLDSDDENVRLAAAETLANQGDRAALPALGLMLTSAELRVRSRSVQILRSLTGKRFSFSADGPVFPRLAATSDWMTWIDNQGQTARLTYPIDTSNVILGRTLMAHYSAGEFVEIDSHGNQTWRQPMNGAFACHGLPNGHRLVASYRDSTIVEYDASGGQVWQATANGKPYSVRRLANGNTLVACHDTGKIQEIKPDTTVAWEVTLGGSPMDARRLDNGNTLVCLMKENRIVEVDQSGNIVWELPGMVTPRSAQRLPNGNTLVCDTGRSRVVEVDRSGRVVWSQSGFSNPMDAQRLAGGNTLVTDARGLKEIDSSGKVILERNQTHVGRVCRY